MEGIDPASYAEYGLLGLVCLALMSGIVLLYKSARSDRASDLESFKSERIEIIAGHRRERDEWRAQIHEDGNRREANFERVVHKLEEVIKEAMNRGG